VSASVPGPEESLLKTFCWPLAPEMKSELDQIRGPPCFALITLSLHSIKECPLSSPRLTKHAKRLQSAIGFLRTMPKVSTLVRWAPGPRRDLIKGEKSALVALAFSSILDVAKKARDQDQYRVAAVALPLCAVLSLLKEICVRHNELLAMLVQDDLIVQRFEALSSNFGTAESKSVQETAEWVLDPCLEQPSMSKDALVPHAFAGVPGALRALEEGENGARAFMELQLKSSWERYSMQEMAGGQPTKVQTKREVAAIDFHLGLSRFEHARLASKLNAARQADAFARFSWRKLTVESFLPILLDSIPENERDPQDWMVSDKEDHLRCRRILARSYSPSDYANAVYNKQAVQQTDDNGKQSDKEQQARLLKLRELIKVQSHTVADLSWFVWLGGKLAVSKDAQDASREPGSFLETDSGTSQFDLEDPFAAFKWLGGKLAAIREAPNSSQDPQSTAPPAESPKSNKQGGEKVNSWISETVRLRRANFSLGKGEHLLHVSSNAQLVTSLKVTRGRVELSNHFLYFYAVSPFESGESVADNAPRISSPSKAADTPLKGRAEERTVQRWRLADLTEIFGRRYLLRSTALELFFKDRTNIFLCFS
jgi:hypothetical protein